MRSVRRELELSIALAVLEGLLDAKLHSPLAHRRGLGAVEQCVRKVCERGVPEEDGRDGEGRGGACVCVCVKERGGGGRVQTSRVSERARNRKGGLKGGEEREPHEQLLR